MDMDIKHLLYGGFMDCGFFMDDGTFVLYELFFYAFLNPCIFFMFLPSESQFVFAIHF